MGSSSRSRLLWAVGLGFAVAWTAGCSSKSRSQQNSSSPEEGVFVGKILDDDGRAVAGALVSVDGIEANAPTNSKGMFVVSDRSLAETASVAEGAAAALTHEIAVLAPGFVPYVGSLSVGSGEVASVEVVRRGLEPDLVVASPAGGLQSVPADCPDAEVRVTGYVDLEERDNFLLDLVIVVDASGSTSEIAFGDGTRTVLEVEKSAVECFLETLDWSRTRVGLVSFNDTASQVTALTSDAELVLAGLESIGVSSGGTNFEAAFVAAENAFLDREAEDEDDAAEKGPAEEGGDPIVPEVRRGVVMLSDGVPTTHGVPPDEEDSNITQSEADRAASIAAARELGEATGAELYGFTIVTAGTSDTRFTTMPHAVAVAGGGRHARVSSAAELSAELCGEDLLDVITVVARNVTTGEGPFVATLSAGGRFDVDVSVVPAGDGGILENEIVVTATAFPDDLAFTTDRTVRVSVASAENLAAAGAVDLGDAPRDDTPLAEKAFLATPTGEPVSGTHVYDFLVGDGAEFEDAVELEGLEALTVTEPLDPEADSVTITVDVVYKNACYQSDFGFVLFDAGDIPSSHVQALDDATADNVLLNTGDLGGACNVGSIAAGTQSFAIDVPVGKVIVFFLLPDFTLESWQNDPRKGRRPIYTVAKLNPAHFVQVLGFASDRGRTQPGASETVVTAGPMVLFAFEDIEIASKRSDQDFGDLIVAVRAGATPAAASVLCED